MVSLYTVSGFFCNRTNCSTNGVIIRLPGKMSYIFLLILQANFLPVILLDQFVPNNFFCNTLFVMLPVLNIGSDIAFWRVLSFPVISIPLNFLPLREIETFMLLKSSPKGVLSQAVKKLNAYKYYWENFTGCVNSLAKTYKNANITKGNGNLYQFINYCTLGATIENDVIAKISTMGMYAEDNNWWTNVKTIFEEIVDNNGTNAGEKYSEYIKTIKTPIRTGYELPKIKFIKTYNGKV